MSKVTTLVPWYGSNRTLARHVAVQLAGRPWVGVPFAGGMSEVRHLAAGDGVPPARTVLVSDLHRHLINLARVAQDPALIRALKTTLPGALTPGRGRRRAHTSGARAGRRGCGRSASGHSRLIP